MMPTVFNFSLSFISSPQTNPSRWANITDKQDNPVNIFSELLKMIPWAAWCNVRKRMPNKKAKNKTHTYDVLNVFLA